MEWFFLEAVEMLRSLFREQNTAYLIIESISYAGYPNMVRITSAVQIPAGPSQFHF